VFIAHPLKNYLITRFLSSLLGKKLNLARCYDVRLVVYLKGIQSSAIYIYIKDVIGLKPFVFNSKKKSYNHSWCMYFN